MKFKINYDEKLKEYVQHLTLSELLDIIAHPNYVVTSNEENKSPCVFFHPNQFSLMKDKINSLKNKKPKLIVSTDMEAGSGTALVGTPLYPSMRAACEAKEPNLAYQMGTSAAKFALQAGINWSFAPCVDLLLNHQSPITSLRSASEDVDEVITYTSAYLHGMQDHGLIGTLKHFPGEGCTKYDQHLTTAQNNLTKDEWDCTYRKIYQTLINEGVASVMIGHISLGCYDEINSQYGIFPPATLSKNLITNLLINDLGFEGIIISDATEMGGFCGFMNYYEACREFLNAGGDMLLFTHSTPQLKDKMEKFLNEGSITLKLLQEKAYKILCFIETYYQTIFQSIPQYNDYDVIKEMTRKSIKVYRDRQNVLPIQVKPNMRFAHFIFGNAYPIFKAQELTKEFQKIITIDEYIDQGPTKYKEIVQSGKYDYIICSTGCYHAYGTNQITLSGTVARNMMNGWTKYDVPVIFVDMGHPYLHEEYESIIDTIIYTYGFGDATIEELIKKIIEKPYNI